MWQSCMCPVIVVMTARSTARIWLDTCSSVRNVAASGKFPRRMTWNWSRSSLRVRVALMEYMPERQRLLVQGAVQGVGFRPFIYRLAAEIGIHGWVSNSAQGVLIEAEAARPQLDTFLSQI